MTLESIKLRGPTDSKSSTKPESIIVIVLTIILAFDVAAGLSTSRSSSMKLTYR